jgi:hypothetical protein
MVGKERYGMNWPGKTECFKTIQALSLGTLRPCPEESYPSKPFFSRGDAENTEGEKQNPGSLRDSASPREPDFNSSENLIALERLRTALLDKPADFVKEWRRGRKKGSPGFGRRSRVGSPS